MFENPRRDRQARNFTTNVSKIIDFKSSSEQIFFRKLLLGAPVLCLFPSLSSSSSSLDWWRWSKPFKPLILISWCVNGRKSVRVRDDSGSSSSPVQTLMKAPWIEIYLCAQLAPLLPRMVTRAVTKSKQCYIVNKQGKNYKYFKASTGIDDYMSRQYERFALKIWARRVYISKGDNRTAER